LIRLIFIFEGQSFCHDCCLVSISTAYVSIAQTNNNGKQQPRSLWDEPIRFSTKTKDSCTMVVSAAGNYTRLRVSCRNPSQATGRSYYCDFQGKPSLCRPYSTNPRHYFTQMMWELRKMKHACQGAKLYRPHMCRNYPDEAQMTFLTSWPKTSPPKQAKPVQDLPAQTKPIDTPKPMKPNKPKPGRSPQNKRTTPKTLMTTTLATEQPDSMASHLASEYCWKSLQGICAYVINWFQS
uniref:Fibroblast growth factor binding protein 2b n=1 Tax=Oryzias latipes TaxID=8090 RepID=A0A3P9L143_ORYLA